MIYKDKLVYGNVTMCQESDHYDETIQPVQRTLEMSRRQENNICMDLKDRGCEDGRFTKLVLCHALWWNYVLDILIPRNR